MTNCNEALSELADGGFLKPFDIRTVCGTTF
jgi:hypothetical protein